MFFTEDAGHPSKIWVDRDGQGRVDHFAPCEPCRAIAGLHADADNWALLRLCQPCRADLVLQSWVSDTCRVERPYRLDPLPTAPIGGRDDENSVKDLFW